MIGINIEALDKIIKVNNINSESLGKNLVKLKECLHDLDNCYDGNGIHFAFSELLHQSDNLKSISEVIQNYSLILSDVKTSYINQDINFQTLLNHSSIKK